MIIIFGNTFYFNSFSYTSDINYMTYDQSYLIAKGTTSKITLDLPCSVSGSTLISYNIANYMTSIAPSWVTIDSSTGELKISAPSVTSDTDYKFYVYSSINGFTNSVPKLIKLTILNCVSKNCKTCSRATNLICDECNSGYTLNSGECIASITTIQGSNQSNSTSTTNSNTASTTNSNTASSTNSNTASSTNSNTASSTSTNSTSSTSTNSTVNSNSSKDASNSSFLETWAFIIIALICLFIAIIISLVLSNTNEQEIANVDQPAIQEIHVTRNSQNKINKHINPYNPTPFCPVLQTVRVETDPIKNNNEEIHRESANNLNEKYKYNIY